MSIEITRWDPSEYLDNDEDVIAYLQAVLEETDDMAVFQAALGDVARARGMSEIARASGLGRESLYKALRSSAHPSLETISKVVHALGGRLTITAADTN
ncbi:addiction module antidote protein [Actinomycetaceae bacterium L2_0104]